MRTADVAILMADDDLDGAGIAPRGGVLRNKMMLVSTWRGAVKQMTLIHEFGHLLGCRHDRLTDNLETKGNEFGFFVDFPLLTKMATIMS